MIFLRRGTVIAVKDGGRGVLHLSVDVAGEVRPALAYEALCGPVGEGDTVVLNAGALELGLGTGGYDFVIAVEGAPDRDAPPGGHAMKMRYTPLQTVVTPVEETHRDALDAFPASRSFASCCAASTARCRPSRSASAPWRLTRASRT